MATMRPESLLAHEDFVRTLARQLMRDAHRADDVAQETWLKALSARPPRAGALRAWLGRIVRNASLDDRRRAARRLRREEERAVPERSVPSPAEVAERESVRREVVDAVLALKEPYRDVILLRYYEMLPPRAIAARLAIPVETARTRIRRGLEQLRAELRMGDRKPDRWIQALAACARPLGAGLMAKTTLKLSFAAGLLLIIGALMTPLVLDWTAGSHQRTPAESGKPAAELAPAAATTSEKTPPGEPEAPPSPIVPRITGQVVDETGAPVASARIIAHASGTKERFLPGDAAEGTEVATTAADGRFEVPAGPAPHVRTVFATAEGFSPGTVAAIAGDPVRIVLERGRTVVGTVRDANERPIAGALVQVRGLIGPIRLEREGRSAADGTFTVGGIPTERLRRGEWRSWGITTSAPGFAPQYTPADDILHSEQGWKIRFDPYLVIGATVKGRVLDAESGAPLGGAIVFLWSAEGVEYPLEDSQTANPYTPRMLDRTKSNSAGEFAFSHVPADGPLPITANMSSSRGPVVAMVGAAPEGYGPMSTSVPVSPDGAVIDASLKCWPSSVVRGRVVDEAGRPMPGMSVGYTSEPSTAHQLPKFCEGAQSRDVITDAEGRYVLQVAAPAGSSLEARILTWHRGPPFGHAEVKIQVRAKATTDVPDLVVADMKEPLVVITVTDAAGTAIRDASLRLDRNASAGLRLGGVPTDETGQSILVFQPEPVYHRECRVLVTAGGFAPVLSPPFTPVAKQTVAVKLVLDRGHRLTGQARWRNGEPAVPVRIYAIDAKLDPTEALPWMFGNRKDYSVVAEYAADQTEADGSFEIRVPKDSARKLVASTSDGAPATLDVPPNARDVVFTIPDDPVTTVATATIEGRVVECASQIAVTRFDASITAGDKYIAVRRVGPGRFRATGIPPGKFHLKIMPQGFAPVEQDLEVAAGATESIVVKVAVGVTLRGRVIASGDLRLEGSIVTFTHLESKSESYGRVRQDGSYEVLGLLPGIYRVGFVLWEPGKGPEYDLAPENAADFEITAGKDQVRDIPVSRGASLYVFIRGGEFRELMVRREKQPLTAEERDRLESWTIEVRDSAGRLLRSGKAIRSNSWTLPYGTYDVTVQSAGAEPKTQRFVLDGDSRNSDKNVVTFDF